MERFAPCRRVWYLSAVGYSTDTAGRFLLGQPAQSTHPGDAGTHAPAQGAGNALDGQNGGGGRGVWNARNGWDELLWAQGMHARE